MIQIRHMNNKPKFPAKKIFHVLAGIFLSLTLVLSLALYLPVKAKAGLKDDAIQQVYRWAGPAIKDSMDKWITDLAAGGINMTSRVAVGTTVAEAAEITDEEEIRKFIMYQGGFVPIANQLALGLSTNPGVVSLAQYKNYLVYQANAPLLPTAKAQDSGGAQALSPMIVIWKAMRNISYMLMAALSVVAGIMIIMRKKIDAKTSVTVMYMIPRMVVSLILITFSFPIVAFIIDLSFSFTGIAITTILGVAKLNIADAISHLLFVATHPVEYFGVPLDLIQGSVGILAWTMSITLVLIVAIAAIFIAFINLITRYARLLLMTAFGPLILVWDFLPGQNKQTNGWIKGVVANALAFPGVLAVIGVAVLVGTSSMTMISDTNTVLGIVSSGVQGLIQPILVIVILFESMKVPKAIDKMLAGKDTLPGWYAPGFGGKR